MRFVIKKILMELKEHGGFTFTGAVIGVATMMLLQKLFPYFLTTGRAAQLFEFSHPLHVILSAMVTAALYQNYCTRCAASISGRLSIILVGYVGSIGIATVSDCIIPYWAELFLHLEHAHPHIGIIEMPFVINFAAFLGIFMTYFYTRTHFPHAGHVLLSTAASLFHIIRAHQGSFSFTQSIFITLFLFIAVWVPCCVSDIIFPLLFIRQPNEADTIQNPHNTSCSKNNTHNKL